MIQHLSYVVCDYCLSNPAQPADDSDEARAIARSEGYTRKRIEDKHRLLDVCRVCSKVV